MRGRRGWRGGRRREWRRGGRDGSRRRERKNRDAEMRLPSVREKNVKQEKLLRDRRRLRRTPGDKKSLRRLNVRNVRRSVRLRRG